MGAPADIPSDSTLKLPPEREYDPSTIKIEADKKAKGKKGKGKGKGKAYKNLAAAMKKGKGKGKGKDKGKGKLKFRRTRYDSVTGIDNGARIHVIYAPAKAYPAYLISFKDGSDPDPVAVGASPDTDYFW